MTDRRNFFSGTYLRNVSRIDPTLRALFHPTASIGSSAVASHEQRATSEPDLLAYWKAHLAGAPPVLALPTDRPRPEQPTYTDAQLEATLPSTLLVALQAVSQSQGVTLFMTLLAAFQVLLSRHSGQEDLVIGTPVADQSEERLGLFVNSLAVRGDLSGDPTFAELLGRVCKAVQGAYTHRDLPFERLVDVLLPERSRQHNPLFQTMFQLHDRVPSTLEWAALQSQVLDETGSSLDLTLTAAKSAAGLHLSARYATDLFEAETVARLLARFRTLLEGVVADPQQQISRLPLLDAKERRQLLIERNETQVPYRRDLCIHQLFEEQAARTPEAVALVFEGRQLTYAQLDARANQLAHYLRQQGVRPDVLVGLCMERSLDMIIGVLGILKAGGAYVPLDSSYPPERRAHMLEDAQAPLLITQQALLAEMSTHGGETICLDTDWDRIQEMPESNPHADVTPDNLIYVIYTSGSTGKPKGTAVFHRGFANLMHWFMEEFGFVASDRSLLVTSISFDLTQKNLYAALCVGGQLHLAPAGPYDPEIVAKAIAQCGATHINCTPSHFYPLVAEANQAGYRRLRSLRYVYLGGEPIDLPQLTPWLSHTLCHAHLVNTYGPTECADIATFHVLPKVTASARPQTERAIPIGRPISNVTLYILDRHQVPVPDGVVGELYIGGAGVGNGYIGRPDLTAEKFLPDPFTRESSTRLYRTGDMCRYQPDGNIEFLGRIDHQVKIRGFRIELGEIESTLAQRPEVREALVMAREDRSGDKRLVAYLVGADPSASATALRDYLRERLPYYMVPAAFVFLEAFPLSLNGKVDRRALPAPDWSGMAGSASPVAPDSSLDGTLIEIWQQVLGVSRIGVDANFFDLGGHSLLAIRLLSEIKSALGMSVSLAEMLQAPTVRQLASLLERKNSGEDTWQPIFPLQPYGDRPPLFCAPVGGGSAFYYRTLAEEIGPDQPVYVFEPIGMNGIDAPHETVEEMAAFYIRHMRTVQPQGPYRICGLSFGGNVAYEMALQLRAVGEKIDCLILFDSCALGYADDRATPVPKTLRYISLSLRYKVGYHIENLAACTSLGDKIGYMRMRAERLQGRLREWRPGKPRKMYWENPVSQMLPEVFQKVSQVEAHAREIYHPQGYPDRIILLRAHLQPPEMDGESMLGWDRLSDNVEVVQTPGSHYSLLEKPNVYITLRYVHKALEDARVAQ